MGCSRTLTSFGQKNYQCSYRCLYPTSTTRPRFIQVQSAVSFSTGTSILRAGPVPSAHSASACCRRHSFSSTTSSSSSSSGNTGTGTVVGAGTDTEKEDVTLYQYAICPFCNIVKSVLHYHKVPYHAVEVNPLTKGELNDLPKDYRKVPILTTASGSESSSQYNGSEDIVDYILRLQQQQSTSVSVPDDPEWVSYARDDLAPLLYPNICSTWSRAHETMGYIHSKDEFTTLQKYSIQWVGSLAMYMAASKIKKKREITDERQALFDTLQQWEDHLETRPEVEQVTVGDLSIYGVLRGLHGLPVHSDIATNFANVAKWYKQMEEKVDGQ
eukprot:CAMPEP_0117054092 /NCGR_PEP_ID=MMETSP0472-20121206/37479_1 /TAXON_ID=693140 ORGANISM="Tiarina fusus, Strain LIS" /NCGR_SAMPLE_ID=MMETSP0472 /ASSEMBLY_ACC=CAM_ASM_000603 /LENGTH=327 /DNA_ID=CAMNT_0004769529 /DNA_START=166 /DNA_END=1149 /DNA_ORIENTATION=-